MPPHARLAGYTWSRAQPSLARARMMHAYTSTATKFEGSATPYPDTAERKAHHVKGKDGTTVKFQNPDPSYGVWKDVGIFGFLIKVMKARFQGKWPPPPDVSRVDIPIVTPTFQKSRESDGLLRSTWLGHACCFLEFPSGLRVLLDPVFEDRTSPLPQLFGPKRYTPPPCSLPADLPAIDAVVISHAHYDHLSWPTVREIARLYPRTHFFVPLKLADWFRRGKIHNVTELDWWEDAELVLEREDSGSEAAAPQRISGRFSCLPSQHMTARTGFDKDHTLWASWAISSGGKSVWFGGDTGYRTVPEVPEGVDDYGPEYASLPRCPSFAAIGSHRGPFDLGLIPIGAYNPRFMFSPVHTNPFDAVEIFSEVNCAKATGIHWGTWPLSGEEIHEPPKLLREALKRKGLPEEGVFDVTAIGEMRVY